MIRAPRELTLVLLFAASLSALGLTSCRTAQQTRRSQGASAAARGGASQNDSLLMIEQRLVDVIDSLTSLVDHDHARIQSLELEVARLRALSEGRAPVTPYPPAYTPYPQGSEQNYRGPVTPPTGDAQRSVMGPVENSPVAAGQTSTAATAQQQYAAALRLFNENNFIASLSTFRELEQQDPTGPYASNYKYWEGENLYALKRYSEALQTFSDVIQRYPNSGKADDAQFKIAESYEHMGVKSSARDAYKTLLAQYPTSEYRARAEARLRALR